MLSSQEEKHFYSVVISLPLVLNVNITCVKMLDDCVLLTTNRWAWGFHFFKRKVRNDHGIIFLVKKLERGRQREVARKLCKENSLGNGLRIWES